MVHRVTLDPRVEDFCPQDHEGRWHIVLLWTDETNIADTNVARGHFTTVSFWCGETDASSLEVAAARVTSCCLESKAGCRLQKKITHERKQDTVFFCIVGTSNC